MAFAAPSFVMGVESLTRESFAAALGVRPALDGAFPSSGLEYLWNYLRELGAASVIREDRYIDRHFLDDFANYYTRAFRVPEAHCARLHFFSGPLAEIDSTLASALSGDASERATSEARLNERYLGFVVRRPLAVAPVGRTVLRTYPTSGERRQYTVVRTYRAHLLGLTLEVQGLAFQQQDGGTAVCASTALWSALQHVARMAGHRTPTPWEITTSSGTPFAASYGLDDRQMATALATLGYAADYFAPAENRIRFRAMLAVCLRSRLPVILLISKEAKTGAGLVRVGHAVVVTGYAVEPGATPLEVPANRDSLPSVPMVAASVRTIYVHDDNLGPHAHYELFDWDNEQSITGDKALGLLRGRSDMEPPKWWERDQWRIDGALVPKPPKLRMPVENLFDLMWSFAQQLFPLVLPGVPLHFSARVTTGIEYRVGLFGLGLDRGQMRAFQERVTLPRFVGVVSAFWGEILVCELLADVTAIDRVGDETSLLAVVASGVSDHSSAWKSLDTFCSVVGVPLITGPRSQ